MRVRVSLADIDPTNLVYYGHYIRYNERAANECLSDAAGPECRAHLQCVTLSKYIRGAGWDEIVEICTTRVPAAEGVGTEAVADTQSLLHEWMVDGKLIHVSVATYAVEGLAPGCALSDAFAGARSVSGPKSVAGNDMQRCRDTMRIRALQKEAEMTFLYPEANVRRDEFTVFPDMVADGKLTTHTVMDLMERQRTTLIGGQEALKELKGRGVAIVCYSIQGLKLSHAAVRARQNIVATSGFVVLNERFYCMHQTLHHLNGAPLSECYLKLIFVRDGVIIKAPEDVRLFFRDGDEGRRYDEHATINGDIEGEASPTVVHDTLWPANHVHARSKSMPSMPARS